MAAPPLARRMARRTGNSRRGPWGPSGRVPDRGPSLPDPQRLGPPTRCPRLRTSRAHPAPWVLASQMLGMAAPPLARRMAHRTGNSRRGPWGPPGQIPGRGPTLPDPQRLGLPTTRPRLRASLARPAPRVLASQARRMAAPPPPQLARRTANLGGPSVPRPEKTSPEVYPLSSCPAVRLRVVICPPAAWGIQSLDRLSRDSCRSIRSSRLQRKGPAA